MAAASVPTADLADLLADIATAETDVSDAKADLREVKSKPGITKDEVRQCEEILINMMDILILLLREKERLTAAGG